MLTCSLSLATQKPFTRKNQKPKVGSLVMAPTIKRKLSGNDNELDSFIDKTPIQNEKRPTKITPSTSKKPNKRTCLFNEAHREASLSVLSTAHDGLTVDIIAIIYNPGVIKYT